MILTPYKIFCLSKNKRLFNKDEPNRMVGIYDVNKYKYQEAKKLAMIYKAKISILLGEIGYKNVRLMCLDLDDCFDNRGIMEPLTKELLKEFNDKEWEVSSSGTGIHVYILTEKEFPTFIVKDMEGSKSFECYTNKRHIVTTSFNFISSNLVVGAHDDFLQSLYDKVEKKRNFKEDVMQVFDGKVVEDWEQVRNTQLAKRQPVEDMYKLRGLGLKDPGIIEVIDCEPSTVDQSAWDAKLIRKLMYYTLSFDSAWELAKKTNYYKHKDDRHKKKFNSETYKERTRSFLRRYS